MHHLILLISLASLFQAGLSKPSYSDDYGSGGYGSGGYGSGGYSSGGYGSGGYGYAPVGYHGPLAKTVVLPDGHIADTPEVAAAKHLHYSAKAAAASHGYSGGYDDGSYDSGAGYASSYGSGAGYGYGGGYGSGGYGSGGYGSSGYGSAGYEHAPVGYHGPLAKTVVLPDGHIADTPEVAAAKHLHYSAIQKAKAQSAYSGYSGGDYGGSYGSGAGYGSSYGSGAGYVGSSGYGGGYESSYGSGSSYSSGAGYGGAYDSGAGYASSYKAYSGPLAYPKVLPSGILADTHEVAAAKHAHLNAVAVTAREHAAKWANNYYH